LSDENLIAFDKRFNIIYLILSLSRSNKVSTPSAINSSSMSFNWAWPFKISTISLTISKILFYSKWGVKQLFSIKLLSKSIFTCESKSLEEFKIKPVLYLCLSNFKESKSSWPRFITQRMGVIISWDTLSVNNVSNLFCCSALTRLR
jgi:hypothetical protein